ncbi:methyltransferase domain-containing protein [Allokutzneria multivorans]|uniref:Methyltransferase domain-containing protein n=1 Tax=Allokutzneria multivorans TaxID=1142134 RepID=A0ABP7TJP2_9PSEU
MITEAERLRSIQRSTDAFTFDVLRGRGIKPSWRCLELGAGAGSVAHWLAEQCPDGEVLAVDIDTGVFAPSDAPNLVVERADITSTDFAPRRFDLVHARFVLCHLAERDQVVERAASWLAPGGWLVVEEPYLLEAGSSPFPVVRRIMAAYQDHCSASGSAMTWARGLPAALLRSGLSDVDCTGNLGRMGGLSADRWRPLIDRVAPELIASGALAEADVTEFHELLGDAAFLDVPQVTLSVWGQSSAPS